MEINHYNNIINYLANQIVPPDFDTQQIRQLEKQAKHYQLENNLLYKISKNRKRIRVIRREEMEPVLYMFHNDPTAAHAAKEKMMDKMRIRYYWPQMYEDI